MKIICKKENDARKMLALVKHLLETASIDYPLLKDDLVLELSLKDEAGHNYTENDKTFYLEEKDLQSVVPDVNALEYYYSNDALTKLYNRGKYERDIAKLETADVALFTCIYIDAVGLHEINNHLGHAAGDSMLCRIAEGIRQNFPNSIAYRIGGDEFVIFCFDQTDAVLKQSACKLRAFLKKDNYEISIGMGTNANGLTLLAAINYAEQAMRFDKAQFYHANGKERQMRSLNYKLEKILLEKQDASQFLNVIASEYKGVYMVNPDKDTCRHIYIPEYFNEILKNHNGVFSKSIRFYCDMYVCEKDQEHFQTFFDYDYVLRQIRQGKQMKFTYTKKDGCKIDLQITIYDANSSESNEMLWIFMDGDKK